MRRASACMRITVETYSLAFVASARSESAWFSFSTAAYGAMLK